MKKGIAHIIDKSGILLFEWVMICYALVTSVYILFAWQSLVDPSVLLLKRIIPIAFIFVLSIVYRKYPNRLTMFLRILFQLYMLIWWYPDTYDLNRAIPNLDNYFASFEQWMFGYQPALYFSSQWPQLIVSEMLDFGYVIYYPMILITVIIYFFQRYYEIEKIVFVVIASFFIYYLIYDFLPVVGPTFYYKAIGMENVYAGIFPPVGDYFATHTDCLPTPGYTDGVFYHMIEGAKAAGERPTAAFPSSHVGVATICMLLLYRLKNKWAFAILLVPYILLSLATVYIQAHYVIDAIAGLLSGIIIYYFLMKVKITR